MSETFFRTETARADRKNSFRVAEYPPPLQLKIAGQWTVDKKLDTGQWTKNWTADSGQKIEQWTVRKKIGHWKVVDSRH